MFNLGNNNSNHYLSGGLSVSENCDVKLIVGLGNPGKKYINTRHNMGFMVVDELAKHYKLKFKQRNNLALETNLDGIHIIKPLTFMNSSGKAVKAYVEANRLLCKNILVIHDDLDMPLGRLRFKKGSRSGGQRGVQDIVNYLGVDFLRLKLGIDHPNEDQQVIDWVLSPFEKSEGALVEKVVLGAVEAIELLLTENLSVAMNHFNGLDFKLVNSSSSRQ